MYLSVFSVWSIECVELGSETAHRNLPLQRQFVFWAPKTKRKGTHPTPAPTQQKEKTPKDRSRLTTTQRGAEPLTPVVCVHIH